jgi:hypothetical protein
LETLMPKKSNDQDSNSTFDFAEWGDRVLCYAPQKPGLGGLKTRFVLRLPRLSRRNTPALHELPVLRPPGASTRPQLTGAPEWQDLPTLVRRSFDAFLIHAQTAAERVAFRRQDPIEMDGEDALIPCVDQRSGARRVARCAPDGSVRCE